jgi:hypothetical protein
MESLLALYIIEKRVPSAKQSRENKIRGLPSLQTKVPFESNANFANSSAT